MADALARHTLRSLQYVVKAYSEYRIDDDSLLLAFHRAPALSIIIIIVIIIMTLSLYGSAPAETILTYSSLSFDHN